jgi:hypothetical protein
MQKCLNCGAEVTGKYCHHCGQEAVVKRLEVKTIFHDVTHSILHWEHSILKTFKELLINPGKTVKKYISGSRKSFVKPFSYFIFIQTIYVLFLHWLSGKYFAFVNVAFNNSAGMETKAAEVQNIVSTYINYLNYFIPFVFAFYFKLFFKKRTGVNYAESLASAFYWMGTVMVFSVIIMLLSLIDIRIWNARSLASLIYLSYALIQFSEMPVLRGIIRSFFTVTLSYLTFVAIIAIFALAYLQFVEGVHIL